MNNNVPSPSSPLLKSRKATANVIYNRIWKRFTAFALQQNFAPLAPKRCTSAGLFTVSPKSGLSLCNHKGPSVSLCVLHRSQVGRRTTNKTISQRSHKVETTKEIPVSSLGPRKGTKCFPPTPYISCLRRHVRFSY